MTRRIAGLPVSRRAALTGFGGAAVGALGLGSRPLAAAAQDATPGTKADDPWAALDADTRESLARALWEPELRAEALPPDILTRILDPKNSNQAFGLRTGARLLELAATSPSFIAGGNQRIAALLPYCASLSPHQAYVMTNLLWENAQGYTPIPPQANLEFPQTNAMQLQSQVGWYFCVGSCTGSDGNEYGVELMFFRFALLPPALAAQYGLSDVENQVVELHLAISKAGERHYQAKPILVAGTTGLLEFSADGFGAAVGKNRMRSLNADALFPMRLEAWGQDDGEDAPVALGIDLTFASGRDYLLQGADGCAPCCDGVGTLYYSIPGIQLEPGVSSLSLNGETIALTAGTFWFDHQWGTLVGVPESAVLRAASNLQPPAPGGWDWFEAQFTGDYQITCAAAHDHAHLAYYFQTGSTPPGTMQVPVSCTSMDAAGETHKVSGTLNVAEWLQSDYSPAPADYPPTHTW